MKLFKEEKGQSDVGFVLAIGFVCVLVVVALIALLFGAKAYSRYQKRADAENQVKVTAIQIKNQEQRVKIAQQKAQIRYQEAIGIRRAQDEIAKTLNRNYLTHEYIQALRESDATTVYIPTSPRDGLPVVTTRNAGD